MVKYRPNDLFKTGAVMMLQKTALFAVTLLLAGCASNYTPVVDPKGVDMGRYNQDLAECRALSEQVDTSKDTATNSAIGAGVGAAAGAALGALSGDAGVGAATGAILGGFGGGGGTALESEQRKKTILNNCLTGRGYRILG